MNRIHVAVTLITALSISRVASAQETTPAQGDEPSAPEAKPSVTPAQKKALYALPYAMRPAVAPNLVRIDTSVTSLSTTALGDAAITSSALTAGGKPIAAVPDLGFYGRVALVNRSSQLGADGTGISNPLAFALWTPEIAPKLRLPIFAGVTAPIGSGGGSTPDKGTRETIVSGVYARQAMDNALFATNYLTLTTGAGIAWIDKKLTVQAEATILELIRTRGAPVDADANRTNFTSGVNVGYQIIPLLTASAELHYQRWLSTPKTVEVDEAKPASQQTGLRDQFTAGGGLRFNVPLTDSILMRPGVAYFRGIDAPMSTSTYQIAQVDVPIAF